MATPPRPTRAEVDAAIARIHRRHERIDDLRRSELGTEPREVIDFVLRRGRSGIPTWVGFGDHLDALILMNHCWWEDRHRELRLVTGARRNLATLSEIGARLGIKTRQGVLDYENRRRALAELGRPDEQLIRAARREAAGRTARQAWVDAHRDRVRSVLTALYAQALRVLGPPPTDPEDLDGAAPGGDIAGEQTNSDASTVPADASEDLAEVWEWLDELRAALRDEQITDGTVSLAALAAAALQSLPTVAVLGPHHPLRGVLRDLNLLRAELDAT